MSTHTDSHSPFRWAFRPRTFAAILSLPLALCVHAFVLLTSFHSAHAAACEAYSATLKQELWPHSSVPFHVYALVHTPGCVGSPEAFCVATGHDPP
jgi:hypothetical protein